MKNKNHLFTAVALIIAALSFTACPGDQGPAGGGLSASQALAQEYGKAKAQLDQLIIEEAPQEEIAEVSAELETITDKMEPLAKYDPAIDISATKFFPTVKFPEGENFDDNRWLTAYREQLGVNVNFKWVVESYEAYVQKNTVGIASGDLAEYIMTEEEGLKALHDGNHLADLTNYYPWFVEPIQENLEIFDIYLDSVTFDTRRYAVPERLQPPKLSLLYVRRDWREALGLQLPESADELIALADAFSNNDPDGNGKNDTYGIAADFNTGNLHPFYAAFKSYPFNNTWVEDPDTGDIVYGALTESTRSAVGVLKDMYEREILDPEFYILSNNMIYEDIIKGKIGMFYGAHWSPQLPLSDMLKNNPGAEWDFVLPPGNAERYAKIAVSMRPGNFQEINKDYEHPEVLFKLANLAWKFLNSKDADIYYHTDLETQYSPFKYSMIWIPNPYENINTAKKLKPALEEGRFEGHGLNPRHKFYYDECMDYMNNGTLKSWDMWKIFGPEGTQHTYAEFVEKELYTQSEYRGPTISSWVENGMALEQLRDESIVTFILNEKPLSAFNDFVEEWYTQGGQLATSEANNWYLKNQ